MQDLISRQAAIEALNGLIDRFEQILRDIRETNVDDSVCGMCEYDGAYIGQSGDWCNECPGFDKDDCFKLSDECRKRWGKSVDLLSAQPFTAEQIQTMQELESAQLEKAYELGKADRPKEPIIRCKECKYRELKDFVYGTCKYRTGTVKHDGFCERGERK